MIGAPDHPDVPELHQPVGVCRRDDVLPSRELKASDISCVQFLRQRCDFNRGLKRGEREGMKLYSKLSQMSPAEISQSLKHKDVLVTNAGDKEVQLQRIQEFDAEVRRSFKEEAKRIEEMQIDADDGIAFTFVTREAVLAATERLKRKQDLPLASLVVKTLSRKAAQRSKAGTWTSVPSATGGRSGTSRTQRGSN